VKTSKAAVKKLVASLLVQPGTQALYEALSKTGRVGVDVILDATEGNLGKPAKDRHPRDVVEEFTGGLHFIAAVDPQPLIDALHDRPQHAMSLVWGLQGSRDKAVIATLVECLTHKDQYVRWAAVEGLARRRQKSLLKPLLAALGDRSDMVRFSALRAIAKISNQSAIEPLQCFLGRKKWCPGAKKLAEELLAKLERAATVTKRE
jgi:hypothetical protein